MEDFQSQDMSKNYYGRYGELWESLPSDDPKMGRHRSAGRAQMAGCRLGGAKECTP